MADHPPTERPPLWRAVDAAWWSLVDTEEPHACPPASEQAACVIRAIADELVLHFDPCLVEHEAVAEWLHQEAGRAKRGEGGHG